MLRGRETMHHHLVRVRLGVRGRGRRGVRVTIRVPIVTLIPYVSLRYIDRLMIVTLCP